MFRIDGKYTNAKVMIDSVDENCVKQITEMVNNVAFNNNVAIMPDCHSGKGSVVGFTMPVGDKVIPNVVGVDIGCGMLSCNIGKMDIDHEKLDKAIREIVPFGMNVNDKAVARLDKKDREICDRIGMDFEYAVRSLGTLGGGNHFIELGKSEKNGDIWITVHSGSRNLGKKICEYWQDIAIDKSLNNGESLADGILRIKNEFPKSEWNNEMNNLRNNMKMKKTRSNGLEYVEGENKAGYISDMFYAQEYATVNRGSIMNAILMILGDPYVIDIVETIHNFIDPKDNIIRKGAIRSYIGERMIIPFNMKAGILLCEGKSNPEWNYSAPHGAGRVYSRSRAKVELDLKKFEDDMKGIFSTSVCINTIDESPDAYKDSKIIEECIEPTAVILDRIIPIHNMKDNSSDRPWKKK